MYINFWYPIGKSDEITDEKPFTAQVFGLPFVAFRDETGTARVLSNTCVHRGGNLSGGWIKDGCAVCPYHGWRYGGDGKVRKIPSLGDDAPPARAKIDAYPTEERYGILFAFLGDLPEEERPPIYDVEEYETDGWKSELYIVDVNCYFERSVENGLDPIHNEFVHPLQGSPVLSPEMQREKTPVTEIPWGSKFFMSFSGKEVEDTALASKRTGRPEPAAGSWHQGPNQLVTWIHFTRGDTGEHTAFHQYFFEQPVDESHTRIFFLNVRNWLLEDEMDEQVEKITLNVVHEDINILEKLDPVRTPETNVKELLLPSDNAVVRYRSCLKDWENRGWRIDMKALRERQGDAAMAVPSPGRREAGNWVFDTVPLMPAGQTVRAVAE